MHQTNEVVQHNQKRHIMLLIFRTLFFFLINVFFIMDAITAAACFFSPRLNNHSLWLCSLPEHSINIARFLGIAKCRSSGCPPVLYLQSARKRKKNKQTLTPISVFQQKRNSLAWNINLPRKRHRESETSSNLMQEKTAIWLSYVNLKQERARDPSFSLVLHSSLFSAPAKCRPLK